MTASYPGAIKTYTAKTDNVDDVEAAHINSMQEEITAIQTELGINASKKLCKAWCRFNGTGTPAMAASYNMDSSITDNGTGDYTVFLTTDFSSANYSVAGLCRWDAAYYSFMNIHSTNPAAGSIRVETRRGDSAAQVDCDIVCLTFFGDQ